jgi:hypothetical protein
LGDIAANVRVWLESSPVGTAGGRETASVSGEVARLALPSAMVHLPNEDRRRTEIAVADRLSLQALSK